LSDDLTNFADIEAAAKTIAGTAVRTPLLESPALNEIIGGRLLVKAEVLQKTGSFKFRGAINRFRNLTDEERKRGVVAFSSGNHGQAVSLSARMVGTNATIVMPSTTPQIKVDRCRGYGAEVILFDGKRKAMDTHARALADERGAVMVPPYDNKFIIAGQGTAGLELSEQAKELDAVPDAILVPCSGGGLTAGVALAAEALLPGTKVYPVEPEALNDTQMSLAAGKRIEIDPAPAKLCDALAVPTPGALTFPINKDRLRAGLTVADSEIPVAVFQLFSQLKIVVEPSGAVGLAAILSGVFDARGKTVVIVASGGNVNADLFTKMLAAGAF
jgi:threonine dehydratase